MAIFRRILAVSALAATALAQSAAYTDSGITFQGILEPTHNITYGFVFPPNTTTGAESQEFIGEIIAPVVNQWVGLAFGGQMADNLLVVSWPNDGEIIFSPRYTTGYIQPTVYAGPTITTLESTINSTYWKWIFRCQNCTTWEGGSMDTNNAPVFAWAISLEAVTTPSDPASNFNEHDDFGFWGEITADAHSDDYSSYLSIGSSSSATSTVTSTTSSSTSSSSSTSTKSSTTITSKSSSTTSSSSTSSAPTPTQTKYGQCGGTGYTGPTVCASGSSCSAVSPPYYYQCL